MGVLQKIYFSWHTYMYVCAAHVQLMCLPLLECYPVNRSHTEAISGVSGIVTHMVVEKGMGHKGVAPCCKHCRCFS